MTEANNNYGRHSFDLEERTTKFAIEVILLCKSLPLKPYNLKPIGQVSGSAGSVGANYREANDALGKRDFIHRLKISRKEAKETIHWLEILKAANPEKDFSKVIQEATELRNILSTIISKSE